MFTTPLTLLQKLRDPADAISWNRFVKLYTPFLLHWARHKPVDGMEAVDQVQEVLIKLVKELPRFHRDEEKGRFRDWLRMVCLHCWIDLHRKQRKWPVQAAAGEMLAARAADDGTEQLWQADYVGFVLRQAMRLCDSYADELDAQTLTIFREVFLNDRRVKDVAEALGVSENVVSLAKMRVLRRLRQDLLPLLD